MTTESPPNRHQLSGGGALALGWLLAGLSNAVAIALLPYPGVLVVRLLHHAFDFGHALSLSLASLGIGWLWARTGRRLHSVLPIALVALVVAFFTLVSDFTNFAERMGKPWLAYAGAAITSQAVPAAYIAGGYLGSKRGRIVTGVAVAAMLVAHHLLLVRAYPGIHLYWVWTAVTLFGRAFSGAELPSGLVDRASHRKNVVRAVLGLAASAALASIVIWPRFAVVSQVFQTSGSVLFPFLAMARESLRDEGASADIATSGLIAERWLAAKRHERPVPATKPRLVPPSPIVILLTFDSLGMGTASELRRSGRWPNVEELARESVEFTLARSPAAGTRQTFGSIFSGRYVSQVQWVERRVAPSAVVLPKLLKQTGLRTIHVGAFDEIGSGALGEFDRELHVRPKRKGQRRALSEEMLPVALEELGAKEGPTFLFMHWLDAHAPYDSRGKEGSKREAYLREAEAYDTRLGELRAELSRRGLWERVVMILAADHGEAFGDHGIETHGNGMYESLLRVPLFIRVPGVKPRKSHVPVTLIDLAPTLLDLLGAPTPGYFTGQSLVPILRGESAELDRPIAADGGDEQTMLFGRYKIIEEQRKQMVELYDLSVDPAEKQNLFGTLEGKDMLMLKAMRYYFAAHLPTDTGPAK